MKNKNFLVLVRHGQSEWNAKNLFTGWKDPDLTSDGTKEAINAGSLLGLSAFESGKVPRPQWPYLGNWKETYKN